MNDQDQIQQHLRDIEETHGVRVILAVESGSRAWGFESPDSDFDVRFVYREPEHEAFRLMPGRDVIETARPVHTDGEELPADLVGWSLSKALKLGVASNPQLSEWMTAPVVYRSEPEADDFLAPLTRESAPRVLAHHYRGLAKRTMKDHVENVMAPRPKKLLYAVRAALAAGWMVDHPEVGASPPVVFDQLREESRPRGRLLNSSRMNGLVDELVSLKKARPEKSGTRATGLIEQWLLEETGLLETEIKEIPEHHVDPEIAERAWFRAYPDIFFDKPRKEDDAPSAEV